MKIFLNRLDTYFGRSFRKVLKQNNAEVTLIGALDQENLSIEVDTSDVATIIDSSERSAVLQAVLDSDVIIYNIVDDPEQAKYIFLELQNANIQEDKIVICLSNLLTWANTKPYESEENFAEEDFRKRKAHPDYRNILYVEKLAGRLRNNSHLKSFVVCAGVPYGEEEDALHFLFKMAWQGKPLPCIENGDNVVPTIHIMDLANIVYNVILKHEKVEDKYLLAVDASNHTLRELVEVTQAATTVSHIQALSSNLGSNQIMNLPYEEVLILPDTEQVPIDMLTLNLKTEPVAVMDLEIQWRCEAGLIENIDLVVQEFRLARQLTPVKILVHGPPVSGKSTLSRELAKEYDLPHIHLQDVIQEAVAKKPEGDEENLFSRVAQHINADLPDDLAVELVKNKLNSWQCRNQGFVLDDFPHTTAQAVSLFMSDKEDKQTEPFLPEFIFVLEAEDAFLKDRVLNMEQSEITPETEEQGFLKRLQAFRENNREDTGVLNFFEEHEQIMIVVKSAKEAVEKLLEEARTLIGKPHNYGPTEEELAEKRRKEQLEREKQEEEERRQREELERKEALEREKQRAEWLARTAKLEQEEREVLELQSTPFRTYLMTHIMPTLTAGLIEVCKVRPEDPIDYLAEYLFQNSTN